MRATDVIMKKRDGGELSKEEIFFLIDGYVKGEIPEYQVSAWLMAVYYKGMNYRETADLTEAMLRSGKTIDLSGLRGPFIDKHSTGGVGDKVSLILAPMVAACGIQVPMMSGRALGHTGGTLDKLESIPGYTTSLTETQFKENIGKIGFAMTGQSAEIVPADKKLYALRDVTGTVESVCLITASILSKKVAEGADGLVFDVKSGTGAFMKTLEDAEKLADSLVRTGETMGKRVIGVITNMNEPLGMKVGNFLEIEETIECLQGKGPADLMEITNRLAGWMMVAGNKSKTIEEGMDKCAQTISSGKALELFENNIALQGGNLKKMHDLIGNYRSEHVYKVYAPQSGYIDYIDALKIGLAGIHLGVGRNKTGDEVYPDVGFIFEKKSGDGVSKGDLVCTAYGKDQNSIDLMKDSIQSAFKWNDKPPARRSMILREIASS